MKRNNLFMLAYIIFIFVSSWLRVVYDYPMWPKLVAAITIASFFLIISDLVYSLIKNTYENMQTETEYIAVIQEEFGAMEKYAQEYLKEKVDKIDEIKKVKIEETIESMDGKLKSIRERAKNIINYCEKYKIVADTFTVLGFLSFFFILVFETVSSFIIGILDLITVLSFGFVLLTQYFSEKQINDIAEVVADYTDMKNSIMALKNYYQQEVLHNAD